MVASLCREQHKVAKLPTVRDVWLDYKNIRKLKPTTLRMYQACFDWGIPDWMDLEISAITKNMVVDRHVLLSKKNGPRGKGEALANNTFRTLKAIINFAMNRYETEEGEPLLRQNPVIALNKLKIWNQSKRRESVICNEDLRPWYLSVLGHPNETVRDYLLLLLFTGLRRSEGANLLWQDVDFRNRMITVRDTKNGRDHILPVGPFITQLLSIRYWYLRPSESKPVRYVFPGRYHDCPISQNSKSYERLWREMESDFLLHDLRRSFLTIAESLDIPHYTLKRLANHKSNTDVTAGYVIISPERLREPMEKIERRLMELTGAQMM